jgi:hypothetical protein
VKGSENKLLIFSAFALVVIVTEAMIVGGKIVLIFHIVISVDAIAVGAVTIVVVGDLDLAIAVASIGVAIVLKSF